MPSEIDQEVVDPCRDGTTMHPTNFSSLEINTVNERLTSVK
jgi:hypothetical protein